MWIEEMRDAFHYDQKMATTRLRGWPDSSSPGRVRMKKLGQIEITHWLYRQFFCEKNNVTDSHAFLALKFIKLFPFREPGNSLCIMTAIINQTVWTMEPRLRFIFITAILCCSRDVLIPFWCFYCYWQQWAAPKYTLWIYASHWSVAPEYSPYR